MQITITIPDELAAEIQSRGHSPERYVEELVAERAHLSPPLSMKTLTLEELNAALDNIARYSEKILPFSAESFTRESFYQDHD